MSHVLLEVDGLDLYYGDAQALSGVSLKLAASEIVAIVGANGAGKSSLIRAIHGIEKPARGTVRFDGIDITGLPSHRVCEAGIGHVAEGRQVFPNLSVLENLEMARRQSGPVPPRRRRSTASLPCFPASSSGANRPPAPCRAANSRCSPSAAA